MWTRETLQYDAHLGDGAFGQVYKATHIPGGETVAVKQVAKEKVSKLLPQLRREVSILAQLQHPNIVRLLGSFEDDSNLYLVMDYIDGGNLYQRLKREGRLDPSEAARVLAQVSSAVDYLHSQTPAVVHRDIKPENILLTGGLALLTDFGWSNYYREDVPRTTLCGTLEYLAPEIVNEAGHGPAADVWCLGILLYEMLLGATPFKRPSRKEILTSILADSPSFPRDIPLPARELILRMVAKDQNERPNIREICQHPWLTEQRESISSISFRFETESNDSDLQLSISTTSIRDSDLMQILPTQAIDQRISELKHRYSRILLSVDESYKELARCKTSQQKLAAELGGGLRPKLQRDLMEVRSLLMEKTAEKKMTQGLLNIRAADAKAQEEEVQRLQAEADRLHEELKEIEGSQALELRDMASELLKAKLKRDILRCQLKERFQMMEAGVVEKQALTALPAELTTWLAELQSSTLQPDKIQVSIRSLQSAVQEREFDLLALTSKFNDQRGVLLQELRKDQDALIIQVRESKRTLVAQQQESARAQKLQLLNQLQAVQPQPVPSEYQTCRKRFAHLMMVRAQMASKVKNLNNIRLELKEQAKLNSVRILRMQASRQQTNQ
jgi:aurora kinase